MNCSVCKHESDMHDYYDGWTGCNDPECSCSMTPLAIECELWKAEAELARVIIDELLAVDDAFLGLAHNQLKDYLALRGENQTK